MPNFRNTASRLEPLMRVTSSPSMEILPASARRIPSTHLIVTDFPLPDPPMTTMESPSLIVRSTPSSTTLGPKRFFTPLSSILGLFAIVVSAIEEERGHQIVGAEDQYRGGNHGVGRGLADALRAAPGVEAVIAAHQRDDEAEDRRLDQAGNHVALGDEVRRVLEIDRAVETKTVRADDIAAENADRIGDRH